MHLSRLSLSLLVVVAAFAPVAPLHADPATGGTAAAPTVEAHIRREPVIPVSFPDYELVQLDVTKQVVFHIGNQTAIGQIPILAYVPVTRAGRASAVDRLVTARTLLVKAAAGQQVSTNDLAALRDLIEQALGDLRTDASVTSKIVSK